MGRWRAEPPAKRQLRLTRTASGFVQEMRSIVLVREFANAAARSRTKLFLQELVRPQRQAWASKE